MDVLKANPCDPVERPKPRPSSPSGLSAPRSSNSSTSSPIPSRAEGTSPSSSLSFSPADADRRSSTSPPAISPSTIPPPSTATSARAVCAAAVNYLVRRSPPSFGHSPMSARTSRPCIPPSRSGRRAQAPGRLQRHLLQPLPYLPPEGRSPSVRRPRPTPHRRQAPP